MSDTDGGKFARVEFDRGVIGLIVGGIVVGGGRDGTHLEAMKRDMDAINAAHLAAVRHLEERVRVLEGALENWGGHTLDRCSEENTGKNCPCGLSDFLADNALKDQTPVPSKDDRIRELEGAKNAAYNERNRLVAGLSKLFPSHIGLHSEADAAWEKDWRHIVFIHLPTGQVSWHIHDSELRMFAHLHVLSQNCWDGHSTEEKYKRLEALNGPAPEGRGC
jgi:hypothetical protein